MLKKEIFAVLDKFVCLLYHKKIKIVDVIRHALFNVKKNDEERYIDLALLPPCKSVLYLHAQRSNSVAYTWKKTNIPQIIMPNYNENGWFDTGKI